MGSSEAETPKESHEPPRQITFYMAGTLAAQDPSSAGAAGGSGGSVKAPVQAMIDLMGEMAKIVETPVTRENQEERNTELVKLRE